MQAQSSQTALLHSLKEFGLNPKDWAIDQISDLQKSWRIALAHTQENDLKLEGWVCYSNPSRFLDLRIQ